MRDLSRRARLVATLFLYFSLISCATTPVTDDSADLKVFSSEQMFAGKDKPNCKALLDSYCNYLYSPDSMGNIEIRRSGNSTQVLQGETKNQFSQVFYRYSSAKIRNEKYLPKDFSRVLSRHNYMGKLQAFLARKPIGKMDVGDRLSTEQLDHELGFIWTSAINETLILRMNHEFPNFYRLSEKLIPAEIDIERRRMRRHLISEISLAVWRGDRNWEKVESGFNALRASYLRLIEKLDVAEDIRQDWRKRINEVRLVLPGSFPEISDGECSATKINAFYYTNLNVMTVCAGDFNSEDIMQTLSHEMAHALGIDRSQYLFETRSAFGVALNRLRGYVCPSDSAASVRGPTEISRLNCQEWAAYKTNFEEQLQSLDGFKPELPQFQQCLKRRVTSNTMTQFDIERIAKTIVADRISELAASERFLRLTKSQIPMINGKTQTNPNFLNPCAYYLWSKGEEPIDDELTTMLYFTAEYRCSNQPSGIRLKSAIETAKLMSERVLQSVIKIEGEFSGRDLLETQGFASPPFERFADVVGSYALAEYFSTIKNPLDRKNKFLAGNSWLCTAPSLGSRYPEESSIETEYIFDSHSEGDQRKKEIISSPIREAIGCEKDFDFKECTLPMKPDSQLKAKN
jgi:hypothetical protein